MTDSDANEAIRKALDNLVRLKGVELPSIPDSVGRNAYLQFLAERGYSEEEVLPVIQRDTLTTEMIAQLLFALLEATKSDDPGFVKAVAWMAHNIMLGRDNSNLIVHEISSTLREDLDKANIHVPGLYAGVFPTNSFNAQCTVFNQECVVLIDTGCMEMAETVVASFLSEASTAQKVRDIATAVDNYVMYGHRANPANVNSNGVSFGSGLPAALTTAFEEYILAHEFGHLVLGHVANQRVRQHSPRAGQSIEVVDKSESQEFEADIWACKALIERARKLGKSDSDLPLAIGGVSLGLSVGLLVEASAVKHDIRLAAGHPPAYERLYMTDLAYELFGAHEEAYVGRRVRELLEIIVQQRYPSAQLPPLLARDLNKKMIPVLDSLAVDYTSAEYLLEFI